MPWSVGSATGGALAGRIAAFRKPRRYRPMNDRLQIEDLLLGDGKEVVKVR